MAIQPTTRRDFLSSAPVHPPGLIICFEVVRKPGGREVAGCTGRRRWLLLVDGSSPAVFPSQGWSVAAVTGIAVWRVSGSRTGHGVSGDTGSPPCSPRSPGPCLPARLGLPLFQLKMLQL